MRNVGLVGKAGIVLQTVKDCTACLVPTYEGCTCAADSADASWVWCTDMKMASSQLPGPDAVVQVFRQVLENGIPVTPGTGPRLRRSRWDATLISHRSIFPTLLSSVSFPSFFCSGTKSSPSIVTCQWCNSQGDKKRKPSISRRIERFEMFSFFMTFLNRGEIFSALLVNEITQ